MRAPQGFFKSRRVGRAVECGGLENRWPARVRGFESLTLRHFSAGVFLAWEGEEVLPMRTPANIARHPIHPMLVAVPIGLWLFSLICDLCFYFFGASQSWQIVAYYTLVGGIFGALV